MVFPANFLDLIKTDFYTYVETWTENSFSICKSGYSVLDEVVLVKLSE